LRFFEREESPLRNVSSASDRVRQALSWSNWSQLYGESIQEILEPGAKISYVLNLSGRLFEKCRTPLRENVAIWQRPAGKG
jgi:hypothetical protein